MQRNAASALLALGGLALIAPAGSAQTESFSADISGAGHSAPVGSPTLFQVGPATATEGSVALNSAPAAFTSYSATAGLPQITGNDLSKFGMAVYATGLTQVSPSIYDYTGTFRIYAPGYGYTAEDGQILEHGTFNVEASFSDQYTATLTGLFNADPGTLQPPGYPVPVDFSTGSPAAFNGTYASGPGGALALSGHLQTVTGPPSGPAVPEAGPLPLLALGGVVLTVVGLRRKRQGTQA